MHGIRTENSLVETFELRDVIRWQSLLLLYAGIVGTFSIGFAIVAFLVAPILGSILNDVLLGIGLGNATVLWLVTRIIFDLRAVTPRTIEVCDGQVRLKLAEKCEEFRGDQCVFWTGAAHRDHLGAFMFGNPNVLLIEVPGGLVVSYHGADGHTEGWQEILLANGLQPKAESEFKLVWRAVLVSTLCFCLTLPTLLGLQILGGRKPLNFVTPGMISSETLTRRGQNCSALTASTISETTVTRWERSSSWRT